MRYTPMEWYRRANMAALGGGADIVPDEPLCMHGKRVDERCLECWPEELDEEPLPEDTNNEDND